MVDTATAQKIAALVKLHFGDALEEVPLKDEEFTMRDNGLVDVDLGTYMRRKTTNSRLPVRFGTIYGEFSIASMGLVSLEGCPGIVNGSFDCSHNQLTSLKHAPEDVVDFDCSHNQLTSLAGCPTTPGELVCANNLLPDLTSAPPTSLLYALDNPFQHFRNTPAHLDEVAVTWRRDLPLLGLLTVKSIDIHFPNGTHYDEVEEIMNKYAGQGRAGMIDCKRELVAAGFEGNARY